MSTPDPETVPRSVYEAVCHALALRAEELVELRADNERLRAELAEYKEVFGHALACVDEVFQECCERPNPILKGYSIAGRCKFEEVKRLARDYVACRSLLREAHRIRAVRDICGTSWSETVKRVLAAKAGGTP